MTGSRREADLDAENAELKAQNTLLREQVAAIVPTRCRASSKVRATQANSEAMLISTNTSYLAPTVAKTAS